MEGLFGKHNDTKVYKEEEYEENSDDNEKVEEEFEEINNRWNDRNIIWKLLFENGAIIYCYDNNFTTNFIEVIETINVNKCFLLQHNYKYLYKKLISFELKLK